MRTSWALWLIPLLGLSPGRAHAEPTAALGSTVDGLQLGLSLTPARSVLPSDIEVRVTLHNSGRTAKTIPISTCHSITWASYARLLVRPSGGKTYRLALQGMIDTADLHPHEPLKLGPGETIEARRKLSELAEFSPSDDSDLGLPDKLLTTPQVELWADFSTEGKASPTLTSGHLTQRFGLSPIDKPLSPGCVAQLVTSPHVACALSRAGTPYCFGDTAPGWDPDTKRNEVSIPRAISRLRRGVRSIDFAGAALCALTADGVFCVHGGSDSVSINRLTIPYRVVGLPPNLTRLWTGSGDACAQTGEGALWCWGRSHLSAPPGIPVTEWIAKERTELGSDVSQVVIGNEHACAAKRDGSVYCWGDNKWGQLGNGSLTSTETPTKVSDLGGPIQQLVGGDGFTCGLRPDGQVLCFGRSEYGAIGKALRTPQQKPFVRTDLGSENAKLFAGGQELCAQRRDGSLYCMGLLGLGNSLLTSPTPQLVAGVPRELSSMSFGARDTCTLSSGGQVHCYGETPRAMKLPSEPDPPDGVQLISGLSETSQVQLGNSFFCALSRAGKVSCWGDGSGGQLGAGKLTMAKRPVALSIPCDD